MKKMDNKGFSLVELIVVVAIMAVLIGVLAPQYLRYVEKSRLQKDNAALGEIANACKIAMSDETINMAVGVSGDNFTITGGTKFTFGTNKLQTELGKAIGDVTLTSTTYKGVAIKFTVKNTATGTVTVNVDKWKLAPDDATFVSHNF